MNRAKESMGNTACVHHWVIDEFNWGRCKNCPAVRDFGALQNLGTRGRPRKQDKSAGSTDTSFKMSWANARSG